MDTFDVRNKENLDINFHSEHCDHCSFYESLNGEIIVPALITIVSLAAIILCVIFQIHLLFTSIIVVVAVDVVFIGMATAHHSFPLISKIFKLKKAGFKRSGFLFV